MICITESWCSDDLHTNDRYQLPKYSSGRKYLSGSKYLFGEYLFRKNGKTGGGITIFIHKELIYNIRHDLSVNDEDTEALCLEIINQKSKNLFINTFYRQPSGNKVNFSKILVNFSKKQKPR